MGSALGNDRLILGARGVPSDGKAATKLQKTVLGAHFVEDDGNVVSNAVGIPAKRSSQWTCFDYGTSNSYGTAQKFSSPRPATSIRVSGAGNMRNRGLGDIFGMAVQCG